MNCNSLSECYAQLDAWSAAEPTGWPLIVNAENYDQFQAVYGRLKADKGRRCVRVSQHTFVNGLPDLRAAKDIISGGGSHVLVGVSQSLMLQGSAALDRALDDFIGMSAPGHAIVLLSHCRGFLEKYLRRDTRLHNRIILLHGERSALPRLRLAANADLCAGRQYDDGIAALLAHLEELTDGEVEKSGAITVVITLPPGVFSSSMYAIRWCDSIYDVLCDRYPDLAAATQKQYGTDEQWLWLQGQLKKRKNFSAYIAARFGSTRELGSRLGEVMRGRNVHDKWLIWLALKAYGAPSNQYLTYVLCASESSAGLEELICKKLLDVERTDANFEIYFDERRKLMAQLPRNLAHITSYCNMVGRHGRDAVYYLTDATQDEEYAFLQTIAAYEWTDAELLKAVQHGFPELALYMREFVFDDTNTKLTDRDRDFQKTLTGYFSRYKSQKIRNRVDADFLEEVNRFATARPFLKLQPRSSILMAMDRTDAQGYFFDALGVEYLSYIQAKCAEYNLICEIQVTHCELPSITELNKDFEHYFEVNRIGELDDLKHGTQNYNYQSCPYPTHIFRELEIIDRELDRIRSQLVQDNVKRAVIISDHGASRLAVIYRHENQSPIELEEKGVHSGRCCPVQADPHIPEAAYEHGYAVLGNYERFRGGRLASLEVHGGASLEETVVPLITLSVRPDSVVYCFVQDKLKFRQNTPPELELFCNVPMRHPRLIVEGNAYDGVIGNDNKRATFVIEHIKGSGQFKAKVFEGDSDTQTELEFTIERKTRMNPKFNNDLFGRGGRHNG